MFIHLRKGLETTNKKYVVILFIDIEEAFDNLWWQSILARIRMTNCSGILYEVMKTILEIEIRWSKQNTTRLSDPWKNDVRRVLYWNLRHGTGAWMSFCYDLSGN